MLRFVQLCCFFVDWHRISLDERPTFSLLVQSKSRQKESTPCFALFPEKLKIAVKKIEIKQRSAI